MGGIVVFLIIIGVGIWIVSSIFSGAEKASQERAQSMISAVSDILADETTFRKFWRYMYRRANQSELPQDIEDEAVNRYYSRHRDIAAKAKGVDSNNANILGPAITKQSEDLNLEIAQFVDPKLKVTINSEHLANEFLRTEMGLDLKNLK